MSNFVKFVQKQTFYEHRSMPFPSNTACCIYDKCVKNGSLAYIWHLKRNKIHLHIIRLFSSFTVFRELSLYESQRSYTHMIILWLLYHNIFTHIQEHNIYSHGCTCIHTQYLVMWCLLNTITFKRTHIDHLMPYIINYIS